MKNNKNLAFALQAINKNVTDNNAANVESKKNSGYLVFPDDKQAFEFLSFTARIEANNSSVAHTADYAAYNWIEVEDWLGSRIESAGLLYLDEVKVVSDEVLKEIQSLNSADFSN